MQAAQASANSYSEEDYWSSPGRTMADRYADTFGGQAINTGDVLQVGRSGISVDEGRRWANEQNAETIRDAIADGRNLAPTVKNAEELQLWDASDARHFPTRMLPSEESSVTNLYTPAEGFFQSRYGMAVRGLNDPNASMLDMAVNTVLGAALLPMAGAEGVVTGLYNAPNNFYLAGQDTTRAFRTDDPDQRILNTLSAIGNTANGTLGILGPFAMGGLRPQGAMQSLEGQAAARTTYAVEAEAVSMPKVYATYNGAVIEPVLSNSPLYHGVNMTWDEIMNAGGLPTKGTNIDMLNHLNGGPNSAFRGTNVWADSPFANGNGPVGWAGEGGTVVHIDGRMIANYDANALTSGTVRNFDGTFGNHVWMGEAEFPIHAQVPLSAIQRYGVVGFHPRTQSPYIENWFANPHYRP